ncbi:hypothetical protein [Rossellomorea sp. FS2]|uniref:hypothetical protein n=1 Tax=Rossellomorea sp. FS2 TaxID=3391447 RepID=UPI003A4DAD81
MLERNEIPVARDRDGDLYILGFSECVERFGLEFMEELSREIQFDLFIENFPEFKSSNL